jgi:hypothetical protein
VQPAAKRAEKAFLKQGGQAVKFPRFPRQNPDFLPHSQASAARIVRTHALCEIAPGY